MKLNVGCGTQRRGGWINIDVYKSPSVDMVLEVGKDRLPFEDNSIDEVYSKDTFEHIENFGQAIEELYRVCKNGARILIQVPHFSNYRAHSPFHHNYFNHTTFYLYDNSLKNNIITDLVINSKVNFNVKPVLVFKGRVFGVFFNWFFNKHKYLYENTMLRNLFPANDIRFYLTVIKDEHKGK